MKIKKEAVIDERIESLRNKFWAQACIIAMALAVASIFVKCLILNLPLKDYFAEACIFVLPCIYFSVRAIRNGILSCYYRENKKLWLTCIVSGAVFTMIMTITTCISETGWGPITFVKIIVLALVYFTVFTVVMYFVQRLINRLSDNRIIKLIGDDSGEQD